MEKMMWNKLSMKDRAFLIREAVRNGITDINSIRDTWEHRFDGTEDTVDGGTIPSVVITTDPKYTRFVNSLPDNQRNTPESEYYTHLGWKLYSKPTDFEEAKSRGMYNWDNSDQSWHGNSIAWDDKTDTAYFLKPKHHETVGYELDWYNKGLKTLEGGKQVPLEGKERKEWEEFKSRYYLDESGKNYKYVPRKHTFSGEDNTIVVPEDETSTVFAISYLPKDENGILIPRGKGKYNRTLREKADELLSLDVSPVEEGFLSTISKPNKKLNRIYGRGETRHRYGGKLRDIFKEALSLYNPWSASSAIAKAASPTVNEGLSDLDTAVQAYVYNDKDARKKMESDHALATASSASAASALMPLVLAPAVAPSVPLLTTQVPSRVAQAFSSIIGSVAAGTAVNEASKAVTGKDFGTAAYDAVLPELWKENPYIQEYGPEVMDMFFNPGYRNGKLLETGILKGMKAADAAGRYASGVKKRTAETIMRIGDQANRLESLAKQFLDKKSLQFILNPNKDHYAYELPFRYSGQYADATTGAHKDDLIDVYLGKAKTLKGFKYGPNWEGIPSDYSYNVVTLDSNDARLPSEVQAWLKKHKKSKIQLIDFGDLQPSSNGVNLNSEYQKWILENSPSWRGGESAGLSDELGYHLIDPGGYNIKPFINENGDFIMSNFDIWKYTPEEYSKKYLNPDLFGRPELFLRKKGLSFLDKAGTPILGTWQYRLPKAQIPGTIP